MVLSSPAHSLPLPPYSPPLYTPLLLQNMASQGWVSRFYDPSTQMWTFYFTSSPDRETWELQSNHFGINITTLARDVSIMPRPHNYYEGAPVVALRPLSDSIYLWDFKQVQGYQHFRWLLQLVRTDLLDRPPGFAPDMCLAAGWGGAAQPVSELRLMTCDARDPRQLFGILNVSGSQWHWEPDVLQRP
jgi:hypothetical protein